MPISIKELDIILNWLNRFRRAWNDILQTPAIPPGTVFAALDLRGRGDELAGRREPDPVWVLHGRPALGRGCHGGPRSIGDGERLEELLRGPGQLSADPADAD